MSWANFAARNMPNMRAANQITWIYTWKAGNNARAGPGHNPPIPHPNPKHIAPITNFQSITLLSGLNSF